MSDHQRRLICRTVFLFGCLCPTLGVFAWAVSYHLPGAHGRMEDELSAALGFQVTVASVAHPQPGTTVYSGLQLLDVELATPLATIDRLELIASQESSTLLAGHVDITAAGAPVLWHWMEASLQRAKETGWEFHAEHVNLLVAEKSHPLADFRARCQPALTGATGTVLFRTRTGDDAQEVQLNVARNRQLVPAVSAWELKTGSSQLPVELLQVLMPGWESFGHAATFRGKVTFSQTGDGAEGCDVSGTIEQVDLSLLVGKVLPGTISGVARFEVEQAQIRDGRLIAASAMLHGGPGQISGALVKALAETWELQTGASLIELAEMESFEQLGVALGINARGLLLRGACERSGPGTLMVALRGPLLRTHEPEHPLLSLAGLFQIVSPASGAWSITPEVQRLARVLPLLATEGRGGIQR